MITPHGSSSNTTSVRDRILEQVRNDPHLPTLGVTIAKIVKTTSSGDDSVSDLARHILSDVSLTQKVLRLSNTANYRTASGIAVTTISRAIFLLGFDTIKSHALASLLVDGFKNQQQANTVRKLLVQALCASTVTRELLKLAPHAGHEEASVAALFKNIGQILLASFHHALYLQIEATAKTDAHAAHQQCQQLLGCSFERLAATVLHDWNIPDSIIHALQAVSGEQKKAKTQAEWLRQIASFADLVSQRIVDKIDQHNASHVSAYSDLLKQFGTAFDLQRDQFEHLILNVNRELKDIAMSLDVPLQGKSEGLANSNTSQDDLCREFGMSTPEAPPNPSQARHPSGKPTNAKDLLLSGIQDAIQLMSSPQLKLNDLLLLVLETLYGAMGFRFATVCLRDVQQAKFLARIAVGDQSRERQLGFQMSVSREETIFHLALNNNVDLMIEDARNPKIQGLLPEWHRSICPDTLSFIVLPLIIDKKQIGFFYADRACTAEEGVSAEETALIKTLKGQLLSAMLRH